MTWGSWEVMKGEEEGEGVGEGVMEEGEGEEGWQRMSTTELGRLTSHAKMRVPLSNLGGGEYIFCFISC